MSSFKNGLDIYLGPMFSGKSSALLRKLSLLAEMGLKVLYINHVIDNRGENLFSTHSPLLNGAKPEISMIKVAVLTEIDTKFLLSFDVVGLDESQFWGNELVPFVKGLVDDNGKYVIVAGLDGSYKREKFGYVLDLIPFADHVEKLSAFCKRCASSSRGLVPAIFTYYGGEKMVDVVNVGGAEKYQAVCRNCYNELTKI